MIIPDGYELDLAKSTPTNIVLKKIAPDLPKSWNHLNKLSGYYVANDCTIHEFTTPSDGILFRHDKNIFPTKEEAEASLALAQLCQLRDVYNGGWKPDWTTLSEKHVIEMYNGTVSADCYTYKSNVLAFAKAEIRDLFMENFKDLIYQAAPLL
jgi:hypothetical protein